MRGAETSAPKQARKGDPEAFQVLVEQHSRQIFHLAYRMTGNEADAEDVVQETFLRAYRKFDDYDSRAQFSSWIHRIAANYAIDLLRRRRRWRSTEIDPVEQVDPLAIETAGPERSALSSEIGRCIERALEALTPRERVAFTMRHYEGRSIAEIGRVLGTRTNSTKNHVFRAVRKLRLQLAPLTETAE
jgi:RNA polymerase sigma-70 factor (ECF subfamily)